jgi:hypothetical protein
MATLSHAFEAQTPLVADQMRGGFDLFVGSSWSNPVSPDQLAREPGVAVVAPLRRGPVKFKTGWSDGFQWWQISGFTQQLLDGGAPTLRSTMPGLTADAAWKMALAGTPLPDGSLPVIVPNFFLNNGNGPPRAAPKAGTQLVLANESTTKQRSDDRDGRRDRRRRLGRQRRVRQRRVPREVRAADGGVALLHQGRAGSRREGRRRSDHG